MKHLLSALALALVATTAGAQVGHLPDNSPYRDIENSQELTFFGGRYTAGLDPFPDVVKVACAQIVKNAQATPALNVKRNVLPDRMQLLYFSDSLMDETVQSLLAPYVAQKVG